MVTPEIETKDGLAPLDVRGIGKVARAAQWKAVGDYWQYPVWNVRDEVVATRGKRIDPNGDASKYIWIPSKPLRDETIYYHPTRLKFHVLEAVGLLHIAAGEPDVLAFVAAGIRNVLCWFGESAIPESLAADLKALGVKRVVYVPDCDKPGYDAAWKVVTALKDSGIKCAIIHLSSAQFGTGFDTNNFWQQVKFDPNRFKSALKLITLAPDDWRLEVIDKWEPPKVEAPQNRPLDGVPDDSLPLALIADIEARLGVAGERVTKAGWTVKRVACLEMTHSRDNKAPSASWNTLTHCLKCHKCGTTMNAKAVAAALNLDWSSYFGHVRTTNRTAAASTLPVTALLPPAAGLARPPILTALEASERVVKAVQTGDGLYPYPFPLRTFRERGGAPFCVGGKMTGLLGASGTGKTTWFATLIDALLDMGGTVYLDSPEWSAEEHFIRDIQCISAGRFGYNRIMAHIHALHCRQDGTPLPPDVAGAFTGADEIAYTGTVNRIEARNQTPGRGHVNYVDNALKLEDKLLVMGEAIARDRANGITRLAVCIDYLGAEESDTEPRKGKNDEQHKLSAIKRFAERVNVHVFLAAQVVKAESARMRERGRRLGAESGHSINLHDFNYLITLNVAYKREMDGSVLTIQGEKQRNGLALDNPDRFYPLLIGEVIKNNLGPTGALVPMLLNYETGRFEAVDLHDDIPISTSRRAL